MIRLVKEEPLGLAGAIITLILLLIGIFADFLAPYGMNESHMTDLLKAPSATYWFGTDNMGRDILSRVIFGARISVIVGLAASSIATVISLIIGLLCGYIGGKLDMIVQRVVDSVMCIPQLILMMALDTEGCSTARIIIRHILPNIMAPTIILFTTRVPNVILIEPSLSFLGFGIPPPTPSWGSMLGGSGRKYMLMAPWMAVWPDLSLGVVVYGINMFGDAVRDLLDPRLRGGSGRYGVGAEKNHLTCLKQSAPRATLNTC